MITMKIKNIKAIKRKDISILWIIFAVIRIGFLVANNFNDTDALTILWYYSDWFLSLGMILATLFDVIALGEVVVINIPDLYAFVIGAIFRYMVGASITGHISSNFKKLIYINLVIAGFLILLAFI